MTITTFWVLVMILAALGELLTMAFFSIWFAVGAFIALLSKWLGVSFVGQFYVFIITSTILILMSEFLLKKKLKILRSSYKTNIDSIIGAEGIVTKDINNVMGGGEVEVMGKKWTALSSDGSVIPAREVVIVKKVDGVKLIVKRKVSR